MKKTTLVAAAFLTTVSSVALAQAPSSPSTTPPATTKTQTSGPNLQQQVTTNLQNSGFTNVKVMPDSFLVQATDKSGNAVTMFIGPNSMTEVTTVGANGQATGTNTGASAKNTGGMFTSVPSSDELSSKVVGLDVYNNDHQNIGTIKDVAYNGTSVSGYILGVGGFLGMGDHYVAVRPSAVKLGYDAKDSKWHATMGQLKSAPEYKYSSKT
jgi:hypothetical protein